MVHPKRREARGGRPAGLGTGPYAAGYRISGRLWLERDGETYLAWGRVVLLERIREHGSISAAARSMGMGYRHAWELVATLNRLAPEPLVEAAAGGRRGGGAWLTAAGEAAVEEFWSLVAQFRDWLAQRRLRAGGGRP